RRECSYHRPRGLVARSARGIITIYVPHPMRPAAVLIVSLVFLSQSFARREQSVCGTYRDLAQEELHLHRAMMKRKLQARAITAVPAAVKDIGDIAIVEDSGDIVARRNDFNLDRKTVAFLPVGGASARYRFQTTDSSYDAAAATAGSPLPQFGDDDTASANLPFAFPFFGVAYRQIFVNSDGNLTFRSGDDTISDRSLGRMSAGPPRIAGLFMDLDPSRAPNGVRVLAEPVRFVVSWVAVPAYQDFG